jgi:Icc-related predicted phosphoesterase
MRITCISDTHTKHIQVAKDLPGGDLLIHAGDLSSRGYPYEVERFCQWLDELDNYDHKVFIPGNHDFLFENKREDAMQIVRSHKSINLLLDDHISVGPDEDSLIKIYGSPWQPEFCNWAFNLPRNGIGLTKAWGAIPDDTDILITHGPPFGILDKVIGRDDNLGCEVLTNRILSLKPKIHVFGHIHSGNGYYFDGTTHFINASSLNERYEYEYKPITIDWDPKTNTVTILKNNND